MSQNHTYLGLAVMDDKWQIKDDSEGCIILSKRRTIVFTTIGFLEILRLFLENNRTLARNLTRFLKSNLTLG